MTNKNEPAFDITKAKQYTLIIPTNRGFYEVFTMHQQRHYQARQPEFMRSALQIWSDEGKCKTQQKSCANTLATGVNDFQWNVVPRLRSSNELEIKRWQINSR
jgi:hypothetical protein